MVQEQGFGIKNAVAYEDGRSHYVFTDKTSLILHPNGDCFTYFRKDGQKQRQLVKYAINNSLKTNENTQLGGPLDKL